ncbi:MAG TPA: PEP-CTERM sorting domain-containing protein [Bryobacteraceae bacterium]|nr:PEP-CTERM sorting domain-containing protein [Bryobacteraceae bacterium]
MCSKALLCICLGAALGTAAPVTFNVNLTIGSGSVTGTIETDGTIGTLAQSDILNWDLLLNDGVSTFTLLGPLSGNNSAIDFAGTDLSETSTQLLFNFSGSIGGFLLQNPGIGSGKNYFCAQTAGSGLCISGSGEGVEVNSEDTEQITDLSGSQVIGSLSGSTVPEPSTLGLLGVGALTLLLRRKQSLRSQIFSQRL